MKRFAFKYCCIACTFVLCSVLITNKICLFSYFSVAVVVVVVVFFCFVLFCFCFVFLFYYFIYLFIYLSVLFRL